MYLHDCHSEGIDAMRHFLTLIPNNTNLSKYFFISFAKFLLTKNAFRFKNKFCLQKQDTTMGMAPSYTDLFMDIFEQTFLKSQTLQPLIWLRYIDGIFFHWQHGIESLNKFLNDLNNPSPMKFTSKYSKTEINFFFIVLIYFWILYFLKQNYI